MSQENFKISGKKVPFPAELGDAKFERRPGGWVIAHFPDGSRSRLRLAESRGILSFYLDGTTWHGQVLAEQRGSGAGKGSEADLTAQFPGKVRKILVQAGALVAEGDPLLLVEAMKMEFAVKAPYAGTIAKVLVKEGQQLSPGDRFLDLTVTPPDGKTDG